MTDVINLENEIYRRQRDKDDREVAEYEARIDYVHGEILKTCEAIGSHGDMSMKMEALLLAAATLAAKGCQQYRKGWVSWVTSVLPYMLRQEVEKIRAEDDSTCLVCTGDAVCDDGESEESATNTERS